MKLTPDENAYIKFYSQITANKAQQPAAHSPLPWTACDLNGWVITSASAPSNVSGDVAHLISGNTRANAKLIVRAVNHVDKLAEALREAWQFIDTLMGNTDAEATDLLTNHGEDVAYRSKAILEAYEADRA